MNVRPENAVLAEIRQLPASLQVPAMRWLDRLLESGGGKGLDTTGSAAERLQLARLVASSEFAGQVLVRDWDWFVSALATGEFGRTPDSSTFAAIASDAGEDPTTVKSRLRRFRNRGLVHILWRILGGADDVWATLRSLSGLADRLVAVAVESSRRVLVERFGYPVGSDGNEIPLIVLAMGKLGGGELNFSSDIDLVFLYAEETETNGPRQLSAHEFFTRLSRHVVMLLEEVTEDGFVYRVDTRLRPFGDSGSPVVSLASLENYLLQHGRSWERYAYVKARVISPVGHTKISDELQSTIIDPFVYRRYLDYGVFESLRQMKSLIAAEVQRRELAENIKLGPGGIREIEFIAQSLQLVRGGADPQLRQRELKEALSRLGHGRGLGRAAVTVLLDAYEFLRRFENASQAIRDQQTHDIPVDPVDRARLALIMGFDDWPALRSQLDRHRENVSRQFAQVAFRGGESHGDDELAGTIASRWAANVSEQEWAESLRRDGYGDPDQLAKCISRFASTSILRQVDVTARKRLDQFMQSLLVLLKSRRHPTVACERVLSMVSQILRRSAYVALLNENPPVLERLVDLSERSAYLASEIERFPLLLDELLDPRLFSQQISAPAMRDELAERLAQVDPGDSEAVIETLARFQRAALFRIAVADVSENLPIMKVSDRLTELAEIVLNCALEVAWRDLVAKHGEPEFESGGQVRKAGFGVIAYGKLGGIELSYQSDLDLVFLHDSRGSAQETNGLKPLDNSMFFGRLVRRLVHFLTAQTSSGVLYEVDTRLRPSGRSGLLVISIDGFAKYQEDNAWTWEHQALLRARPVAGSAAVTREFERIRADTLRNRIRRDRLLDDVIAMRQKMRQQLDKSTATRFDLKQGEGGIGDIEFIVQYLVLKHAGREPALIHYSDNIRQLGTLGATGCLTEADVGQLQEAYKTYRLRTHRLALNDSLPLVDAREFLAEREFVKSVWAKEMK